MSKDEWEIAKVKVKELSCCCCHFFHEDYTNNNFLTSLDELIAILFGVFSGNGDITRRDNNFFKGLKLLKRVLSKARIQKGVIYFSFPSEIRACLNNVPKQCAVKLEPGNPTRLYGEWIMIK